MVNMPVVSYIDLFRSGELERRRDMALEMLVECSVCPRNCGVDRAREEKGFCGIGRKAVVSSCGPHFGEESPLVGRKGSGTIFFSGCNLGCRFCQNWDISQRVNGGSVDADRLASLMMQVQGFGCHNLNLVSPTHVVPQIIEALEIACLRGFQLPIVYNTGGYDSLDVLKLLDGIVDIYMPDMKYSDPTVGKRLSLVDDYPDVNFRAVKEMHRQVGDLKIGEDGVAERGLLIRHLVLPNDLAGTEKIANFLSNEVSSDTYINVMAQYRPEYQAMDCEGMGRRPSREEYLRAVMMVMDSGLHRLD